ncbi:DUF3016 domain-containing protein [Shewanella sp. WXL01]|uniref:DUF3016 domain-containing protein n=1 Tax=Shewanella maritima TaxID=2520507 RepID=A0A411PGH8_9GAMM|nr:MULTISPECIES: DUF3016 domain-containing protein [Shewanella]NKF49395.1 DUF3016 domain-containing protein [Shewanella sp. WXL01]QBF82492.1 DUF3016 domain-containing protein [Shewanella maritima]
MRFYTLILASVFLSTSVMADDTETQDPITEVGVVKIEWQNPKKFRDIKTSNERQSRFEARLFETLTKNLDKEVTKTLKPNQKLEMQVSNLDLAGDMRPTFGATTGDLRIIKDLYPPRMTFTYQVLEGDKVVVAGDEKLVDMTFMNNVRNRNHKPFQYETVMLKNWFNKTVAPQVN